jgi:hypothetical protein
LPNAKCQIPPKQQQQQQQQQIFGVTFLATINDICNSWQSKIVLLDQFAKMGMAF